MKHNASISGVAVRSDCDYLVYGPTQGVAAECNSLSEARHALDQRRHEAVEWNAQTDLAIFRWGNGQWTPALSLYDLQEIELEKNPSSVVHFP